MSDRSNTEFEIRLATALGCHKYMPDNLLPHNFNRRQIGGEPFFPGASPQRPVMPRRSKTERNKRNSARKARKKNRRK